MKNTGLSLNTKKRKVTFDQDAHEKDAVDLTFSPDNGLRSPRLDYFYEDSEDIKAKIKMFKPSPPKSILKRNIEISEKKINEEKLFVQDRFKSKLFLVFHNTIAIIINEIIKNSGDRQKAKKNIASIYAAIADYYLALNFSKEKRKKSQNSYDLPFQENLTSAPYSHCSTTLFKVPKFSRVKSAIILDLYRGALQISNEEKIILRYEKALHICPQTDKTRKHFSEQHEFYPLELHSKQLIIRVLDDFIQAVIGLYQGSHLSQITQQFIDLIYELFTRIQEGEIFQEMEIAFILSELNDAQIDIIDMHKCAENLVARKSLTF